MDTGLVVYPEITTCGPMGHRRLVPILSGLVPFLADFIGKQSRSPQNWTGYMCSWNMRPLHSGDAIYDCFGSINRFVM
jgi:hypothetical protein